MVRARDRSSAAVDLDDVVMQLLGNRIITTGDGAAYVSASGKALLHAA